MAKKEVACCKLAMICQKVADKILAMKLVRIVAPLINDEKDGVQVSAVGALKNLSMVSEEVCEEMVAQVMVQYHSIAVVLLNFLG